MAKQKNIVWVYIIGALVLLGIIIAVARMGNAPAPTIDVEETDWIRGNRQATVTLMEYADFQCPACGSYHPVVDELLKTFENRIRFVFRHFPLTQIHPNAMPAAQAAEAAGKQGKFWEMHDQLFDKQHEWSEDRNAEDLFARYAESLGLDKDQFLQDYRSAEIKEKVTAHIKSATALNINSTPTFILNGEIIRSPGSFDAFRGIIEAALTNAPLPEIDSDELATAPDAHEHVDLALYVNGKKIDLSQDKYQSDSPADDHSTTTGHDAHNPYVHLHNKNGSVVHKHKDGVTLGYFLTSIGMNINKDCLTLDTGEKYCGDENNSLKFFVNGERSSLYDQYELHDLDRVLISFGSLTDSGLDKQLASVTNDACIYSEKCPERGTPPEEKCVGGLGTDCEQ